ncbi:unnamed protein product [Soboliphyme baturini]|uniref:BPTI/Kunitz inhibitor domain-containing protein n=1 Tax=Soboliphyme baturini TaxID=241478 RepID=A0A183IDS5_9BILA|nr:unnamed protein product [Soboliphyme baturini]
MIQLVLALQFLAHSFAQTDICTLPAETGPCRTSEIRYFYNAQSRKCEEFLYGGCLGNANNFETKKECETYCGKEKNYCNPYTEEYSNCGTMCPETCWNSGTNVPCATICVPGCICKPGFVRAGRSCGGKPYDQSCNQQRTNDLMPVGTSAAFLFGPCIPRAWCNATYPPRPPIMRCPYNEHYEECGTACPETCLTLGSNVPCPLICKSGCFCNDGYVRAGQSVGMPVPQIPLIFPSSDFGNHGQGPCVPIFQCSLYTPGMQNSLLLAMVVTA